MLGPGGPTGNGGGSEQGSSDAGAEPSGPPAVRYVGRFDTSDPDGPKVGWPGARIIVRFEGTSLTAKITEKDLYKGPSGYDVIVDGKVQATPFVPQNGAADHVIAKDLAAGTHVVELWRRTEAVIGITQFRGFDFGGGKLLAPPVAPSRRIEFLGDSATSGYGVECTDKNESFSGATQNERKSFPAIVARTLGADHHNLSMAGKGLTRNYDPTEPDLYPPLYERTLPEDPTSTWSFGSSWVPDVVVIALGSNDFDNPDDRLPPDLDAFKTKYHELVTLVRSKNPKAEILCTVAAELTDEYPADFNAFTNMTTILKEVVDERHAEPYRDAKVHYHELVRASTTEDNGGPDLTGCEGHPNEAFHEKVAADLVTKIKSITGW